MRQDEGFPHVIRPSYYAVPDSAHPMVRMLFSEMLRRGMSLGEMAAASGIDRNTISSWRRRRKSMSLFSLECCLTVLGLSLLATPDPARVSQLAGEVAKLRAEKAVHAPHYDFVSP